MPRKSTQRIEVLRRSLAEEAARIMADQGIDDFLHAKRKAADRLGVHGAAVLPRNVEIEAALRERQRLFGSTVHDHNLEAQRRVAIAPRPSRCGCWISASPIRCTSGASRWTPCAA